MAAPSRDALALPSVGHHNEEILKDRVGLGGEEIAALRQ